MERSVKFALEAKGYYCVRAAGSHGIDLVAWKESQAYVISCKNYKLSPAAKARELKPLIQHAGPKLFKALVLSKDFKLELALELADRGLEANDTKMI